MGGQAFVSLLSGGVSRRYRSKLAASRLTPPDAVWLPASCAAGSTLRSKSSEGLTAAVCHLPIHSLNPFLAVAWYGLCCRTKMSGVDDEAGKFGREGKESESSFRGGVLPVKRQTQPCRVR